MHMPVGLGVRLIKLSSALECIPNGLYCSKIAHQTYPPKVDLPIGGDRLWRSLEDTPLTSRISPILLSFHPMRVSLQKSLAKLGPWLDDVQETWIGWSLPPTGRAIDDAGWKQDDENEYCNRCGVSIGRGESTKTGCGSCRTSKINTDALVRLGPYIDDLKNWVCLIKYQQWHEMGDRLGKQLGVAIRDSGKIKFERSIVVPMPMPWQRRIYRGVDHALVIAGAVSSEIKVPLMKVLCKANGKPQVAMSKSDREKYGGKGIRLSKRLGGWDLTGLQIILIDDVKTTGASIRSATRILRKAGASDVIASVIAVSEDPARRERSRIQLESSLSLP